MTICKHIFTLILIAICFAVTAQQTQLDTRTKFPNHPRLLCLNGQEKRIASYIKTDVVWEKLHQTIVKECDRIIKQPTVQPIKIGKRLLDKSRTCLQRVFYLSYAYRLTHEEKYLKRAEAEMLAAANFPDWNPTHFLDVGEMTMALAIGYDWLYNDLSESSRAIIKDAILKKGIEPSLDSRYNGWLKVTNNWNQVCNAGIAYGAIATYEEHPELSVQIINRAITSMALPMQQYAPDGGYPEGYMYWEYGTSFNVMFISALQEAFGSDFGLASKSGFSQTATFLEHLSGTTGKPFNYGDCVNNAQFSPAVFWFANYSKDATVLWEQKSFLTASSIPKSRLLPATFIWSKSIDLNKIQAPTKNVWVGKGVNQVALLRTSWTNPKGIFVGFKAGSPSASHGHMDVGSFVVDADGERWAMDFGMQDYESLESKGIDLWNMQQNSQRWQVFRYNNLAHNTIAINSKYQEVQGNAIIKQYSQSPNYLNAMADLTPVYASSVKQLIRGVSIINQKYVVVRDEVETLADSTTFRWSMVTPATVKIINDSTAELSVNNKKMILKTQLPFIGKLSTWSTVSTTSYDASNPNTVIVGFEIKLPPNSKNALNVFLIPENAQNEKIANVSALALWPKQKVN